MLEAIDSRSVASDLRIAAIKFASVVNMDESADAWTQKYADACVALYKAAKAYAEKTK